MKIEITLTSQQAQVFGSVVLGIQEWVENAVFSRVEAAENDIAQICVSECLKANMQVPATKSDIIDLAFAQSWVKSAETRQAEYDALMAQQLAELQAQQEG